MKKFKLLLILAATIAFSQMAWAQGLSDSGTTIKSELFMLANATEDSGTGNSIAYDRNGTRDGDIPCLPSHGEVENINAWCNETFSQGIALAEGWNWFSTDVEISLDDLKTALLTALPNTSVTIKSRTQSTKDIVRTHLWNGTLDWDITKMYKIEVPSACEITLEGDPINPAEHPITIVSGPNWIGYPLIESMAVTEAFANFEAVTGDVLKSKSGSTRYRNGSWRPNGLTTLEPGQGYIFNSAATGNRTLVFPSSAK